MNHLITNATIMPCPFCGKMPEFETTGTFSEGIMFGVDIKFGCSNCDIYPGKRGHIYRLGLRWDINNNLGVAIQKDERLDLIRLWNTRINVNTTDEFNTNKED